MVLFVSPGGGGDDLMTISAQTCVCGGGALRLLSGREEGGREGAAGDPMHVPQKYLCISTESTQEPDSVEMRTAVKIWSKGFFFRAHTFSPAALVAHFMPNSVHAIVRNTMIVANKVLRCWKPLCWVATGVLWYVLAGVHAAQGQRGTKGHAKGEGRG